MAYRPLPCRICNQQHVQADGSHDASLGPEDLKAVKAAFDPAWLEIEGNFSTPPITVRVVRRRLAEALLSISTDNKRALKLRVRNDVR